MADLSSTELRKGTVFKDGDKVFRVKKYKHVKKGRGLATIRVKVQNVETGAIVEKTYSSNEKVNSAQVTYRSAQFLYADGSKVAFMDLNDYSQFEIEKDLVEREMKFLTEGEKVKVILLEERVIGVEVPIKVELDIKETGPGIAGDTAGSATKEATLETGYKVQVPLFIKKSDKIVVNTETGEYVSKA